MHEAVTEFWVLVSEPGFLEALAHFLDFFLPRNETQEQHSLLDTIFDYIFYFGPPGTHLYKNQENLLHVGRLRRRTCSGF